MRNIVTEMKDHQEMQTITYTKKMNMNHWVFLTIFN